MVRLDGGETILGKSLLIATGADYRLLDVLYKSMSAYLARRIEETENIELCRKTVVQRMMGDDHLTAVEVKETTTNEVRTLHVPALFSFIGAVPRTDWLPPDIEIDAKGFVCTGSAVRPPATAAATGPEPFLLETSQPGVFAAGDVRSGSIKRVASAVGEGSMPVHFVHERLRDR